MICPICKTEFTPTTGQQRFCSAVCRVRNKRRIDWERRNKKPWVIDPKHPDPPVNERSGLHIDRHTFRADLSDTDDEGRRTMTMKTPDGEITVIR